MQKGLYIKNKGLSITAGILMAAFGVVTFAIFLISEKDFSDVWTWLNLFWGLPMLAFAVLAMTLVKRNITWILLPIAMILLMNLHTVWGIVSFIKENPDFLTLLEKFTGDLLLLATLVLFILCAVNPKKLKLPLVIVSILTTVWFASSWFSFILYLCQNPELIFGQLKEYGSVDILYSTFTMLQYVSLLLFALSINRQPEQPETLPEPPIE